MAYRPIRFERSRVYPMTVAEAWRLLADTNHLNRSIGLPSVEFSPMDGAKGKLVRNARARAFWIAPVRWREYPFDWVRERHYVVRREFEWGPVAVLEGHVALEPAADCVKVRVFADFTPANPTGLVLWRLGASVVTNTLKFCDAYLSRKQHGYVDPTPVPADRKRIDRGRLEALVADLQRVPVQQDILERLRERVMTGSDDQLLRVRAFELADVWQADRSAVLSLLLHAASVGMFELVWELMCPNCRVPKADVQTLSKVPYQFHCDTCGISFDTNLNRRVELRFSIHPRVRQASDQIFCIGGPLRMPHVAAQLFLRAGESRRLDLPLQQPLRLRAVGGTSDVVLTPATFNRPAPEMSLIYAGGKWAGPVSLATGDTSLPVPAGCALVLRNQTAGPLLAVMEDVHWTDQATTAAQMLEFAEFRDLFPSEVLEPGHLFGAHNVKPV